jgi:Flp pilus assembly pilin Flp
MLSRRLAMMPQRFWRFWKNEEGIAVTEYGLLIALVAVLLIGVVSVFSSSISSWFSSKTNKITSF